MLQVNLTSVFIIGQRALPHLARTGGNLVNTSSLATLEGLGEPRDVAAAFACLVSDDARFVSSSVLIVDCA